MEVSNDASFAIVYTQTDYDRFNLKKYVMKDLNNLNPSNIITFIEDVRMKRLDPQYKSEKVPSE